MDSHLSHSLELPMKTGMMRKRANQLLWIWTLGLAVGASGTAQTPTHNGGATPALAKSSIRRSRATDPIRPTANRAASQRVRVDKVLMAVANDVLLESQVERDVRSLRDATPAERKARRLQLIEEFINTTTFADIGRTSSQLPAEELVKRVGAMVDDDLDNLIRETPGGLNAVQDNLARINKTLADVRHEKELEQLYNVGLYSINAAYAGSASAMVTPRQMKAFYDAHLDEFRRPASATIRMLTIEPAPGQTFDALVEAIDEARTAFRHRQISLDEFAQRFGARRHKEQTIEVGGGNTVVYKRVFDSTSPLAVRDSMLIRKPRHVSVLIVTGRAAESVQPFLSERTQDQIRRYLRGQMMNQRHEVEQRRRRTRTFVWPPAILN